MCKAGAHQSVALRSPAGLIRRIAGTLLPIRPPGGEAQSTRPETIVNPQGNVVAMTRGRRQKAAQKAGALK